MTICRLMVLDFTEGTGRYDETGQERYDDMNLDEGAAYANWLLSEGYLLEPFYGFDLEAFEKWCLGKLSSNAALEPTADRTARKP